MAGIEHGFGIALIQFLIAQRITTQATVDQFVFFCPCWGRMWQYSEFQMKVLIIERQEFFPNVASAKNKKLLLDISYLYLRLRYLPNGTVTAE